MYKGLTSVFVGVIYMKILNNTGNIKDGTMLIEKDQIQTEVDLRHVMGSFEYFLTWAENQIKKLNSELDHFQGYKVEVGLSDKNEHFIVVIKVDEEKNIYMRSGFKSKGRINNKLTLDQAYEINNYANMSQLEVLLENQMKNIKSGQYFEKAENMRGAYHKKVKKVERDYVYEPRKGSAR